MNLNEIIQAIINSGLLAAVVGLLVSGVKYFKNTLDLKTQESAEKIKDAKLKHAFTTTEDCITSVVYKLAQTTGDKLKELSADGKLTKEDADNLKDTAFKEVVQLVGADVYTALDSDMGDFDGWIKSKIEAAVKKLHIEQNSKATPVTIISSPEVPSDKGTDTSAEIPTEVVKEDPSVDSTAKTDTPATTESFVPDAPSD